MRDIIQRIDNILNESQERDARLFQLGDEFGISFSEDLEIATTIVGFVEDGIVVELDDTAISIMESNGARFIDGYLEEGLRDSKDNPCWKGYKPVGTKKKNGKTVPNCVPKESIEEAEYQGRDVTLNKPTSNPDSGSKSKVYVKDPQTGNVKKVTFGDPNMRIKKSNPERRKSFRARHNCDNPGPKTKARYWSCKAW